MPSPPVLDRSRIVSGALLLLALAVLALSAGVAALALATARGVTYLGDDVYDTEFISAWWWLAFPLVVVPAATARRRPRAAGVQTVALVLPHYVAAAICVARYRSAGWGDGLEVFAFVHPLLLTGVAAALVILLRPR